MKRATLTLIALLLLAAGGQASDSTDVPSAPFFTTVEEAKAAVADDGKILVEFYTEW